jgi:ABC-type uncharacterized transport system substrate-binding protein
MRNSLALGIAVAGAISIAPGCGRLSVDAGGRQRVVVVNPRPAGLIDATLLAQKLARETGAEVSVRDVEILSHEAIRDLAARIVAEKPALVVAPASDMVFGLRHHTHAIPILFVSMADPIHDGLVTDTQRPRGNVSGFSFHVSIESKQLEMLKRAYPRVRRIGVLGDRYFFATTSYGLLSAAAHDPLRVQLVPVHFEALEDLGKAIAAAAANVDAWLVPQGAATHRFAAEVVRLLNAGGKPAIFGNDRFVRMGGLMSYSQSFEDPSDRVVQMAKSVLGGFPVGDLPVERPQNFKFAINTASWGAMRPAPSKEVLLLGTDFHDGPAPR